MARKTKEELEQLKKEHNVSELWSWSKYNSSKTDLYGYFLKYIKRIKEDKNDSIYGVLGNSVHDLLENFYNYNYKKEELLDKYKEEVIKYNTLGYMFNRSDKEKNDNIGAKYNYCNEHFFENFIPIKGENIELEKFITIKVSKFLFQGYSDFTHEEIINGRRKKIITDFKTSSIYKGEKIEKERGQLLLYALGEMQNGWDIENIIIRWLFTKYVNVEVPYKNSSRIRQIDRMEIGSSLNASVKKELNNIKKYNNKEVEAYINKLIETKEINILPKEVIEIIGNIDFAKNGDIKKPFLNKTKKELEKINKYTDSEIKFMLEEMILLNNINNMPNEIKEKFIISDCFVEIPFNKDDIKNLQVDIIKQIVNIKKKEMEYLKTKDDKVFWCEIDSKNEYYYNVLCGFSRTLHKPYNEYLKQKEEKSKNIDLINNENKNIEDIGLDDLFAELGIELE